METIALPLGGGALTSGLPPYHLPVDPEESLGKQGFMKSPLKTTLFDTSKEDFQLQPSLIRWDFLSKTTEA